MSRLRRPAPNKALSRRTEFLFSRREWNRGESYYYGKLVKLISADLKSGVVAEVQGSQQEPYHVVLDWTGINDGALLIDCDCPRFADASRCKHVIATIIAADRELATDSLLTSGRIRFLKVQTISSPVSGRLVEEQIQPAGDDDDDIDDESEWEEDGGTEYDPITSKAIAEYLRLSNLSDSRLAHNAKGSTGDFADLLSNFAKKNRKSGEEWELQLAELQSTLPKQSNAISGTSTQNSVISYSLDLQESRNQQAAVICFQQQFFKQNGELGSRKTFRIKRHQIASLPNVEDRKAFGAMIGNQPAAYQYRSTSSYYRGGDNVFGYDYNEWDKCKIVPETHELLIPLLCLTGRFGAIQQIDRGTPPQWTPLHWDGGDPWKFQLQFELDAKQNNWLLTGNLVRGEESISCRSVRLALNSGLVLIDNTLARFETLNGANIGWIEFLQDNPIQFSRKDEHKFVENIWRMPAIPGIDWPEELRWQESSPTPKPCLKIRQPSDRYRPVRRNSPLPSDVSFDYDGQEVDLHSQQKVIIDSARRCITRRDPIHEAKLLKQLYSAGFNAVERSSYRDDGSASIQQSRLNAAITQLVSEGWQVVAEGKAMRPAGQFNISVSTGVDWFDLAIDCDFAGVKATLPDLLAALQHQQNFVELGDGTRGVLPEEWLKRYGALAELAQRREAGGEDSLRFLPSQAMVLDALLAAQPNVEFDQKFKTIRQKILKFSGVQPRKEPRTFRGELRDYQRIGLGWLNFLAEFGFGGCLADDMGLGKTSHVLAYLEARRTKKQKKESARTSLVVVPKSLVFNWVDEASRFAPNLKVMTYHGAGRAQVLTQLDQCDLLVTTYGTLRTDITTICNHHFDYAILDEAQAVKNSTSQSSKACRLIQADHRLAMSGTPVENHLGELWTLFEFLNPGMLGRSAKLSALTGKQSQDTDTAHLLAKMVRPFLLRRTKEQVLKELPAKTEQTLMCDLDPKQRKLYNQLRDHYRALLTNKISAIGLNKSKIYVLEALLRLRQAACHPALIDQKNKKLPSAKLESLLEQLSEVLSEGHKILVFSQFTSLLAIVRKELDTRRIGYEYLDGKTNHRQQVVERFQTDPTKPVFLISLKAGGQGLNLTSADYVFILDPWWNPAVEAQAVDRAHRLGQTKPVFAYRLIARDTVEEKILELQGKKRDLADAIIGEENATLRNLTSEDLMHLLS